MNTVTHRMHQRFLGAIETDLSQSMRGEIIYHPNVIAPDGSLGVYRFEFQRHESYPFNAVQYAYEVLAASMPLLENNLAYYPMPLYALPRYLSEQAQYDDSRVNVLKPVSSSSLKAILNVKLSLRVWDVGTLSKLAVSGGPLTVNTSGLDSILPSSVQMAPARRSPR